MPLQHVPISCPSPQGWYYCPFSFLAGSVNFIMIMTTIECGQFNSNSLRQNPKSFQQVILLFNFVTM